MEYQRLREKLISLVRKNRCIYDKNSREYASQSLRDIAWKKISEETHLQIDDAKIAWRTLRERYTREIKKLRDGVVESDMSPWPFYKQMSFLENHIKPRHRSFHLRPKSPTPSPEHDHTYQTHQETLQTSIEHIGPLDDEPEGSEYLKETLMLESDISDEIEEEKPTVFAAKSHSTTIYQRESSPLPPPAKLRRVVPSTPQQSTSAPEEPPQQRFDVISNYMRILEEKFRLLPQAKAENIILRLIAELNSEEDAQERLRNEENGCFYIQMTFTQEYVMNFRDFQQDLNTVLCPNGLIQSTTPLLNSDIRRYLGRSG
ncbi:hypothetical protein DMENIID0001_093120 [Sergentomyia squamirostris]